MSIFRRRTESEQAPGDDPGAAETPWAGNSAEERPSAAGRERFPGSIEAPTEGALVGGTIEVEARLADGDADEAVNVGAWLAWSRDGVGWNTLETPGDDYELSSVRAGEAPARVGLVRSLELAETARGLLEERGYEQVEIAPAGSSSWQGRGLLACACDTTALPEGACLLRLITIASSGDEITSPSARVLVDNLGPSVTLSQDSSGEPLEGVANLVAEAEDEVSGVSLVELELSRDGQTWNHVAETRKRPFALELDPRELDDGAYLLRAIARDGRGNESTSDSIRVEIANPPAAELVDPGKFLRGQVSLIARALDRRSTQMVFEIAAASTGDWRALGTARAPFHLPVDTRQIVDGAYDLRIEARTASGRAACSQRFGPYVVDNSPPSLEIAEPAPGEVVEGGTEIVVDVADEASGPARVELSYSEEGEWRRLAELEPEEGQVRGFWHADSCRPGPCRLRAVAFDRAGNEVSQIVEVMIASPSLEPESPPEHFPESERLLESALEPAQSAEPASEPILIHQPPAGAEGRFGQVPSWDWHRLCPGSFADVGHEVPGPEEAAADTTASGEPGRGDVAWRWKGPKREHGAAEPLQPSSEPGPPEETNDEETVEESKEPEPPEEPRVEEPEPPEEPIAEEPEPKPESEREEEPGEEPPEPEEEPEEAESLRAVELAEPEGEKNGSAEGEGEGEEGTSLERGRVVEFPRVTRGWDIWELAELVEETPGQDPIQQEERRQILYYLREHTRLDGLILPEFEDLVLETFGELMPNDDSPA
jgi:hypothetical protein